MRIGRFLSSCVLCGLFCAAVLAAVQANTDAQKAATERMRQIWPNLPPNQNPEAVARGKQLFSANCTFCHGADATGGNGGPDLIRSVLVNHDEHGNLIAPVLRGARADKGMPKFDFTDAQIADLVAFLHQRNRDARLRFTYKIADVAVGDSLAGKRYFDAHCRSCHSPSGDLAHIASKYPADVLQQLWLDPAGAGQPLPPSQVSITLPSGQKLSGKLEHRNEFNVSFFDPDGVYHSLPVTAGMKITVENPVSEHEDLLRHLTDSEMHNVTTYLETLK
ncbi:MAG TPA: c-type cytochrome [Bryobacteraceae bacterium]|nr:c-type cytochrome [Bryobacteraceae bacterium]